MSSNPYTNLEQFPRSYYVGSSGLVECQESDRDLMEDPRGVLWMWEAPMPGARYILSGDPTVGITGWCRAGRTDDDTKVDNGAIEVFRPDAVRVPMFRKGVDAVGNEIEVPDIDPVTKTQRFLLKDLQVAEFAAPVDAVEFARVLALLGRIYRGDADEHCELIFESYPGPGILTLQELLRLNYSNLWMWEKIADNVAEQTSHIGWYSGRETQKILWYRARRHLMGRRAVLRSKWLVEEYSNAVIDMEKMRAKAAYGYHDDRMQAANMAFWAAHKWIYDDVPTEPVRDNQVTDYQTYAPTIGEYRSYKEAMREALSDW